MGYLVDPVPVGIYLLIIYMIIDCIRNRRAELMRRVMFYSFVVYLLYVLRYTTGGFLYPPRSGTIIIQLRPLQFILDWVSEYQRGGLSWSFWSSVKLTLYNVIMLLPLGVYLKVLYNVNTIKKAAAIILLGSAFIETCQLVFSYSGLVFPRTFNIDDIMLNTLGGVAGYCISAAVLQKWFSRFLPGGEGPGDNKCQDAGHP